MSVEIRCPYCKNGFTGTRATCPFCGLRLPQHVRAQAAAQREAERRKKDAQRAQAAMAKAQKAQEREANRQYQEARDAEALAMTAEVDTKLIALGGLLGQTLSVDDAVSFESLKDQTPLPEFEGGVLAVPRPAPTRSSIPFNPPLEPRGLSKLIPGARKKYEAALAAANDARAESVAAAEREHEEAMRRWKEQESKRESDLAIAKRDHDEAVAELERERANQHQEIETFERAFLSGDRGAISRYFSLVFERSPYPEYLQLDFRLAYVPESRQLVVEKALPTLSIVPEARSYRYVKARDEIAPSARPMAERRRIYSSIVGQIVLRTLHEVFEADTPHHIETVVVNAYVDTIDPRTGQSIRPYLVSVRTSREQFADIDLARVEPLACLSALNAGVSRNPAELVPIRPILDFNMVDPRFVEEADVLSTLDQRANLMELTPGEFEALITNLFERMGLETRMTQPSRDGGVDCVAYDPRSIFGGKVVIQAKRYKNTVGVSAVRDLFGTMQNEGANRGILVTTSGYGRASFDFADGKPLELLSGSNLLYLLKEHAGMDARIEPPDDWIDPTPEMTE